MSDELNVRQARLDALRQQAYDDVTDFSELDEVNVTERTEIHAAIVEGHRAGRAPELIAQHLWNRYVSPHKYSFEEVVDRVRLVIKQLDATAKANTWRKRLKTRVQMLRIWWSN